MAKGGDDKKDLIARTRDAARSAHDARLTELAAVIRRKMAAVVEGFYEIGLALKEIRDRKLYTASGHATLSGFLKAERLVSARQAAKLIKVVENVTRERAIALGPEKSYALVAYTEATPETDSVESLAAAQAPVTRQSTREIQTETKAARPRSPAAKARAREDAALARALRSALRDGGIARAEVAIDGDAVRITLTRAQVARLAKNR